MNCTNCQFTLLDSHDSCPRCNTPRGARHGRRQKPKDDVSGLLDALGIAAEDGIVDADCSVAQPEETPSEVIQSAGDEFFSNDSAPIINEEFGSIGDVMGGADDSMLFEEFSTKAEPDVESIAFDAPDSKLDIPTVESFCASTDIFETDEQEEVAAADTKAIESSYIDLRAATLTDKDKLKGKL